MMFIGIVTVQSIIAVLRVYGDVYELNKGPANWYEADETCSKNGSSLVTIGDVTTIAELDLQRLQVVGQRFWTGLSRHKKQTWEWSSHGPYEWSNWYTDEQLKTGECAEATWAPGFWWYVTDCWEKRPFLCEYVTNDTETDCTYQRSQGALIIGHTHLTSWADDVTRCKFLCDTVVTFTCRSFHHSASSRLCYLNNVTRWDTPEAFAPNPAWDYYHKTCSVGRLGNLTVEQVDIQPSMIDTRYTTMIGSRTMVCTEYTGESTLTQPKPNEPTKVITEPTTSTVVSSLMTESTAISTQSLIPSQTQEFVSIQPTESAEILQSSSDTSVLSSAVSASTTTEILGILPGEVPRFGAITENDGTLKRLKEKALRKKRISEHDNRVSATIIGSVAILLLLGVVALVIVADDGAVVADCKRAVANIKSRNDDFNEDATLKLSVEGREKSGSCGSDSVVMNNLDTSLSISDNLRQRGMMNFLTDSNVNPENNNLFKSTTNVNETNINGQNGVAATNGSALFLVQQANRSRRPKSGKPGSRNSRVHPTESFARSELASRCSFADNGSFREVEMTMNADDTESVDFPPLS